MGTITEEKAIYKTINEKMGETVSLSVEKLHLSEYNTRSTCIDMKHVDNLAGKIKERGFHPKRAISVNVIRGAGGGETAYRVAAGIHRMEAARRAGLSELPCLLYYDLTEEEECLLDKWDNEMDEDHKKIHFLEEAEHYRYLIETKKWSKSQIARIKGVERRIVQWRLQISNVPEPAKKIIRGCEPVRTLFFEKYFQHICKLKDPHIITICEEIAEHGRLAEKKVKDKDGNLIQPMRQSDIEKRVKELIEKQKKGKIDTTIKTPLPQQLELFPSEETMEEPQEEEYTLKTIETDDEKEKEPPQEPAVEPQPESIPEIPAGVEYVAPKNSRGLDMNRGLRWLDLTGLIDELGQTAYIVLREIEKYDLWYRAHEDKPFFLDKKIYPDPYALLAKKAGVGVEHIQKRVLPQLKKEEFIDYWIADGRVYFKFNWQKIYEVYRKKAYTIPFYENGLKDMPTNFSGAIRPTPIHYLKLEKGKLISWNGEKEETVTQVNSQEEANGDILKSLLRSLDPPMREKEIGFCLERREATEIALKLLSEMPPEKRRNIRSEAGYLFDMVKNEPKIPKEFITPSEEREKEKKRKVCAEFVKKLKEEKCRYFYPDGEKQYEILDINEEWFLIEKEDRTLSYVYFEKWMDMKYFK